jgi:hypothetical protein
MNNLLILLAFIFALGATLLAGGIITGTALTWLLPAALATYFFALLVGYAVENRIFVRKA